MNCQASAAQIACLSRGKCAPRTSERKNVIVLEVGVHNGGECSGRNVRPIRKDDQGDRYQTVFKIWRGAEDQAAGSRREGEFGGWNIVRNVPDTGNGGAGESHAGIRVVRAGDEDEDEFCRRMGDRIAISALDVKPLSFEWRTSRAL
jgi:hypothetical protein